MFSIIKSWHLTSTTQAPKWQRILSNTLRLKCLILSFHLHTSFMNGAWSESSQLESVLCLILRTLVCFCAKSNQRCSWTPKGAYKAPGDQGELDKGLLTKNSNFAKRFILGQSKFNLDFRMKPYNPHSSSMRVILVFNLFPNKGLSKGH